MPEQSPYTLADMLRDLLKEAARGDALAESRAAARALEQLGREPDAPGWISPEQVRRTLTDVLRGEWHRLERFPTLTVEELGTATTTLGKAQKRRKDRSLPDSPPGPQFGEENTREAIGIPVGTPRQPPEGSEDLGLGLSRGVLVDPEYQDSYADAERLADLLNRLAINEPGQGSAGFAVEVDGQLVYHPADLITALEDREHEILVRDVRYLADFGHLRYKGHEVAVPLWIDTRIDVPGRPGRTLVIPSCHSEHRVLISGPEVNAEVCFYFGIDGGICFRPVYVLNARWLGFRVAHEYTKAQAREAVRLVGEVRRAFATKQARHPDLPLGGYFVLGVCNDSNALVELGMTGTTTLYPLTRDPVYFKAEDEVDRLARSLPSDAGTEVPNLERILGSLPETDFARLPFPELRDDLTRLCPRRS